MIFKTSLVIIIQRRISNIDRIQCVNGKIDSTVSFKDKIIFVIVDFIDALI